MRERQAFLKKIHPEQFSDSHIIRVGILDREFFDFFLDTLTNKGLEKDFEKFCVEIAETEICPNLLPQTGPTGGGDSKVDSETYPVSEAITERWLYEGKIKAGQERWAFAISAKKEWKPKVLSDIAKIVDINNSSSRGYNKVFFISNQYISDKKRAETEDLLRATHNIDVRILDRSWLLEKTFISQHNKEIAINRFNFSDNFKDEVLEGSNDYKRRQALLIAEERLLDTTTKHSELILLAEETLILSRELELPERQIIGLIDRYLRLAHQYGNRLDIANAIYNAAHTIYWWVHSDTMFYDYYKKYEALVLAEDNVYLFGNLITLFISLSTVSIKSSIQIDIEEHSKIIREKYKRFICDSTKPNTALEARANYQFARCVLGDDINSIVEELIFILKQSEKRLDLNLDSLSKVIQEFPLLAKAERYEELFELCVLTMSQRDKETVAAQMLFKRGQLIKGEKPYEALAYFSRTLLSFYNNSNKRYLIHVLLLIAEIYENIGLFWAARNLYYYTFCLCITQYFKFGEINPAILISSHALKYIELRLGQIIYSCEFLYFENITLHIYPAKLDISEENHLSFDSLLAVQILRTPFEVIAELEKFPNYLIERGLHISKAAIEYKLGYYNEEILKELEGDKKAFDDMFQKMSEDPVLESLDADPWYGFTLPYMLRTSVLGCSFELWITNSIENGEVEVAATVLASIESFFGTGVSKELLSFTGKIELTLRYDESSDTLIKGIIREDKPNMIDITFKDFKKAASLEDQDSFFEFLCELLGMVTCIMFPFQSELPKIKKMVTEDLSLTRAQTFSNSIFYGMEIMGKDAFSYHSVVGKFDSLPLIKGIEQKKEGKHDATIADKQYPPLKIHYSKPPDMREFNKISHNSIQTSNTINILLWNKSKWRGICYITPEDTSLISVPPIFVLLFSESHCVSIFREWIDSVGKLDNDDHIEIRVMKGINKSKPSWYRVAIGNSKLPMVKEHKSMIFIQPSRLHTMETDDISNLSRFEQSLSRSNYFYICPAIMTSSTSQPKLFHELMIAKKKTSISICHAWEIKDNDLLALSGILPTDNPIIPMGIVKLPILEAIKRKREDLIENP